MNKELIDEIMIIARAKGSYLLQGDIVYPKSDNWYSEMNDQLVDCDIIVLSTLREILEKKLK